VQPGRVVSDLQRRPDRAADALALMTHVRVTVTRVAVWSLALAQDGLRLPGGLWPHRAAAPCLRVG
jgi:hypothetical protein